MTYAAPSCDFYDDGLVHGHDWARNTPPGGKHGDRGLRNPPAYAVREQDDSLVHDHRWNRG